MAEASNHTPIPISGMLLAQMRENPRIGPFFWR